MQEIDVRACVRVCVRACVRACVCVCVCVCVCWGVGVGSRLSDNGCNNCSRGHSCLVIMVACLIQSEYLCASLCFSPYLMMSP